MKSKNNLLCHVWFLAVLVLLVAPVVAVNTTLSETTTSDCLSKEEKDRWLQGITFNAGPEVCNGWDLFVTGDYLYWTAKEDGLAFATTGGAPFLATASVPKEGSVRHPDFGWYSGYKIGLGYHLPYDGWSLFSEYNFFHTQNQSVYVRNPRNPNNQLVNVWGIGGAGIGNATNLPPNQVISFASGRWNIGYHVMDLSLGRNNLIGRRFALETCFGLRGTWQSQKYKTYYFSPPIGGPGAYNRWQMKQRMDMWGIGVRAGLNSHWRFQKYISIAIDGALSVLMSHFKIHRQDNQKAFDNTGTIFSDLDLFNSVNSYYSLKAVFDFFIGLQGDYWTSNQRFHALVRLGWEEHLWISQSNFLRLEENAHGDLSLNGLTIQARVDF